LWLPDTEITQMISRTPAASAISRPRVGDEDLAGSSQPRAPQDLARIGQLRDRLGRHERADLQALEAAGGQLLDEGDLGLGRDERLDGLEAVAWRDLENFDLAHGSIPVCVA
jgi:hypothetical protein